MKRLLVPALLLNAALLAVRAIQEASPPPVEAQAAGEVILDNGRPGTSFVGSWTKSSAPSPFGTESLYNSIAGNSYTWQLTLPASGEYEVYAWWTVLASRAPAAPYVVTHAGGTSTVTKDQRSNGGKWNLLGKWSFTSSGRVQVRTTANFSTSADAIRFVRIVPPAPQLTEEEKEILSHFSIEHLPAGAYCVDSEFPENCPPPNTLAKTIRLTGVNLQVVNGTGTTETINGLGNVIVGYQEPRPFLDGNECFHDQSNHRRGSHNLIVGREHNYESTMGIAVGWGNALGQTETDFAAAAFGLACFARTGTSFVGGGQGNVAGYTGSAVIGGSGNWSFEENTVISGGVDQKIGDGDCGGE